ncbi:MAG: GFA family protein [Pseudomonadota bacterium]
MSTDGQPIRGRCYCGRTWFEASAPPKAVTYCHCSDCRRVTGAPVAAFAAFYEAAIRFTPDEGRVVQAVPEVKRSFCPDCGSPLTGRYDYLPGAVYVAIGLFDDPGAFPPQRHSHADQELCWLRLDDDLNRHAGSARSELNR